MLQKIKTFFQDKKGRFNKNKNTVEITIEVKPDSVKKEGRTPENYGWNNVAALITNMMALSVYCSVSPAIAEYQGKKLVYNIAVAAIILMGFILLGEIYCLIKNQKDKYLEKGKGVWRKFSECKWPMLPVILFLLYCVDFGIHYYNLYTVNCYDSVIEVYGIPEGAGEPLKKAEQEYSAGYWKIKTFQHQKRIEVTYVEPYHQLELMQQNSTAYDGALFQPTSKIIYEYKKDKEYYFSQDQEAVEKAEKRKFWVTEKISYYSSSNKLLLQLERNEQDRLEIMVYSAEDKPQMLNSTLLRVPDGQTVENGILSQQIETVYDSDGLPVMSRFVSNVNTPYGVNGECYIYNEKKQLAALYYVDSRAEAVCNKSGIMRIAFEYGGGEKIEWIHYYSDEKGFEKIEGYRGVSSENLIYNDRGNLIERRQLDRSEHSWYDTNGVSIYQYEYEEESGRLRKEAYLDSDREPIMDRRNYCFWTEFEEQEREEGKNIYVSFDQHNGFMRNYAAVGYSIDKDNHIEDERYYNEERNLLINDEGYARVHYEYDDQHRIESKRYFDSVGQLCLRSGEYAMICYEYTLEQGDELNRITYLNGMGEITNNSELGYAYVVYDRQLQGRQKRVVVSYYDKSDRLAIFPDLGYAIVEQLYDENGLLIQEKYRMESKMPAIRKDYGASEILYDYAEDGNLIRIRYKDTQGRPVNRIDKGYAAVYQKFEKGLLQERWYEEYENGTLKAALDGETGYAKVRYTYYNGQKVKEQYFDTEDDPVLRSDIGCASQEYAYNDQGKLASQYFYDTEDNLVLRSDTGYAVVKYEYNKDGRCIYEHFYGTVEEHPVISTQYHCAGFKYDYDVNGNQTDIWYLGTGGKGDEFMIRPDLGYAHVEMEYDAFGKCISEYYYDTKKIPVISTEYHCAGFQYAYDKQGNRTEIGFLGVDKELMIRLDLGYAQIRYQYDDFGNEVQAAYYDTEGKLTALKAGGYTLVQSIYENGDCVEKWYCDANGGLVQRKDEGYAIESNEYNEHRCIAQYYYDVKGKPVMNTRYHYAGIEYEYDVFGNIRRTYFLGVNGELIERDDLGVACIARDYDDSNRLVRERYYDANLNMVNRKDAGYAEVSYIYEGDERVETIYYGIDGEQVMNDGEE